MAIFPKTDELFTPTIEALKKLGGSGTNREIFDKIVELGNYSQEILNAPQNERESKLEYRSYWAKSYLKIAGAVENSTRGVWALTKKGETITVDEIIQCKKAHYIKQKEAKKSSVENENEDSEVFKEDAWKSKLLATLKEMHPTSFEKLTQRILRESGFIKVEVTGGSGDGGIDGSGILRVNLITFKVLFQCKRFKDSVVADKVRDFRGAMQGRADKGLIITTGRFTTPAEEEATRDGAPTIDLIDGEALCDLLKNLQLGVSVQQVEKIEVNSDFFENF